MPTPPAWPPLTGSTRGVPARGRVGVAPSEQAARVSAAVAAAARNKGLRNIGGLLGMGGWAERGTTARASVHAPKIREPGGPSYPSDDVDAGLRPLAPTS